MRSLIIKIKAVLSGRRGESLMESVASLFIFLILLMAITTMIKTALQITSVYTREAASRQETVINEATMEQYTAPNKADLILQGSGIDIEIPIELFPGDGCEAFRPEESSR